MEFIHFQTLTSFLLSPQLPKQATEFLQLVSVASFPLIPLKTVLSIWIHYLGNLYEIAQSNIKPCSLELQN